MDYRVNQYELGKYVEVISVAAPLGSEQDAVDLVALCKEHDTTLLLLQSGVLADAFFKLGTGTAGQMIQKWINYHVKTAAVAPQALIQQGRFREMALESNKSTHFGIFASREEAVAWLCGGQAE